ncbi:MAG: glycosyltransferase family 4 protein [Candidatus Cryptobacteroides sp.]
MKRILFVHHISKIGGASFCLLNILKALDREKLEPVVCLASEGPLADAVRLQGIECIFFPSMSTVPYNRPLLLPSSIRSYVSVAMSLSGFSKLLKDNKIDIVYLNNMMLWPYLRPAKNAGCATVFHVREHWPLDEHCLQLGAAREYVRKYADRVVAINSFSASMFPRLGSRTVKVMDWSDIDARCGGPGLNDILDEGSISGPDGEAHPRKTYIFTGGFNRIKGAAEVMTAFSSVIKDPEARLLVLGAVPLPSSGLKYRVKAILDKLGYHDYHYQVQKALAADSRIICRPAVYDFCRIVRESSGFVSWFTIPHANLALAECIMLGVPCIAADNEEAREYTGDGEYALLAPAGDYPAFKKALALFAESGTIWRTKASEGSPVLRKMFDPSANAARLNELLLGL